MNHILAALFAIGILFGVYTGLENTLDIGEVQPCLEAVRGAVTAAVTAPTPAAAAGHLAAISEPLAALSDQAARLPRGHTERMQAFQETLDSALAAASASTAASIDPALASALADLEARWTRVEELGPITSQTLTVAALSAQGKRMFEDTTERAKSAVLEIAFPLIGLMAFWLGIMRVAEEAGIVQALARGLRPLFKFLFPKVPRDHPANGAILMSMAANIIGLDNAATPLSLKAMKELQTLNLDKETLTDAQGMLLTLNATSITLVPFSIIGYRLAYSSQLASDIVVPMIIATFFSTLTGIVLWKIVQRMSPDPAAGPEEAARITAEINAELQREAHR